MLMLLRNMTPESGLCNGTRMIFKEALFNDHDTPVLLKCVIANGTHKGDMVLIPRIRLSIDDTEIAYKWSRTQFPVMLAFAMTINKSQGQGLDVVGVHLPEPVFNHGQLYVAVSRVTTPNGLRFAIQEPDASFSADRPAANSRVVRSKANKRTCLYPDTQRCVC